MTLALRHGRPLVLSVVAIRPRIAIQGQRLPALADTTPPFRSADPKGDGRRAGGSPPGWVP
jgi:hypothetical protein